MVHRSSLSEGTRKGTVSRGVGGVVEIATGQSTVQKVTIRNIHLSILVHVRVPDVEQRLVHGVATQRACRCVGESHICHTNKCKHVNK